jgi:hypothetical protein
MVLMVDRRNQRQMVRGMEHRITAGLERAVLIRTNWWRVLEQEWIRISHRRREQASLQIEK